MDALFLGPPGTGKSHLVQAIGRAVILQGWEVAYREAHVLLDELADATLDGTRKDYLKKMQKVPLLVIDDLGMRQLPKTAAEDLLELVMRRYERTSTVFASNRAVDEWASSSATAPRSGRCSIACCTTRTSCSAVPRATGCCASAARPSVRSAWPSSAWSAS
jgi:DNA replication protein DnaC